MTDMRKQMVTRHCGECAKLLIEAEQNGFLFHGSPNGNLSSGINPQDSNLFKGSKVVFAGKPWVAVSCTAKWNDSIFEQGATDNGTKPYMRARQKDSFDIYDKGGFVYLLSPDTFESSSNLTSFEFISREPVKPYDVIFIDSPVDVLKKLGVEMTLHVRKQFAN